ncbi:MAG: hypothetical protein ACKO38_04670 [Planctomycetota bacterium]
MVPVANRDSWRATAVAGPIILGLIALSLEWRWTAIRAAETRAAGASAIISKPMTTTTVAAKPMASKPMAAKPMAAALKFPLDLRIVDPSSESKQPPAIIVFEKGLDTQGKDVTKALERLKSLRGSSKMFPKLNEDPGLPVVLRGLRFHKTEAVNGAAATYAVDLLGEFNRVRVPVSVADMEKFLAGERVELKLKGSANYGVYSYESSIGMELRFDAGGLTVFRVTGDFRFRELLTTYVSATRKIDAPTDRQHLYSGEIAELPDLPAI